MLTRDVSQHSYEVQQFTGFPVSRHDAGNWDRGVMYRGYTETFRSSAFDLFMYDPTNPLTWNNAER